MAVYPVPLNISLILVTLLVSNFSPKSKLVMAVCPVLPNITYILITLLVSKLSPKSKLVMAVYPVLKNIKLIFVTLLVFNNSILVIVTVAVQFDEYPIQENK